MKNKPLIIILLFFTFIACKNRTHDLIDVSKNSIKERFIPPLGYNRIKNSNRSFGSFLQQLELAPFGTKILDFKGNPIPNQNSHVGIVNYDIGNRDLQQCADAIIRLRAEYLFDMKRYEDIEFKFTSGHNYRWLDYANGIRPIVRGNQVTFRKNASLDRSYSSFRKYLDVVFMYAGTISLNRDLNRVNRRNGLEIGDVIVKPGSPGHAVIVVDKANNSNGDAVYLLCEGYTPAQSIHILDSKERGIAPWFKINRSGPISSERYHFINPNIRRF